MNFAYVLNIYHKIRDTPLCSIELQVKPVPGDTTIDYSSDSLMCGSFK